MRGNKSTGMGDVTVAKAALITILRDNRAVHRKTFDVAVVKFREQAIERLDALITEIKQGKLPQLYVPLPMPEEHTGDYDRAIKMLEMHIEDTITLSEDAYARLVDDDWGWKQAFFSNTASYVGSAQG